MIPFFFTGSVTSMLLNWVVYVLAYYGIIRKMGAEQYYAFVPVAAEWRMSKNLFASMRSFYQPALSAIVFLAAAHYVGSNSYISIIFWSYAAELEDQPGFWHGRSLRDPDSAVPDPLPDLHRIRQGDIYSAHVQDRSGTCLC